MVEKVAVLRQLKTVSNEIAEKFDSRYSADLDLLAQELASSFDILHRVINDENNPPPDHVFQSALLFWTALNSILSSLELLRRGYTKEPQIIMRNVLEIFAVAYDFRNNPERYSEFISNPKKFKSTDSIAEIKKIHKIITKIFIQVIYLPLICVLHPVMSI